MSSSNKYMIVLTIVDTLFSWIIICSCVWFIDDENDGLFDGFNDGLLHGLCICSCDKYLDGITWI